jgi:hypothetical protein
VLLPRPKEIFLPHRSDRLAPQSETHRLGTAAEPCGMQSAVRQINNSTGIGAGSVAICSNKVVEK